MRNDVHLGHKARKRFGQNFLNDPYIIDGIVSAINLNRVKTWLRSVRVWARSPNLLAAKSISLP